MSELIPAGSKTDQEWADYCADGERGAVDGTIRWCGRIFEAKQNINCSFDHWAENHYTTYSSSSLKQLAKIGEQADRLVNIVNRKDVANDWGSLYQITKMSDEQIAQIDGPINRTTLKADPHVLNNSGNNEWYTPSEFIEAAREVMGGINLDPASSEVANRIVRADRYFDESTNGLDQKWIGRVWMNPPYAQPLVGQFIELACSHYASRSVTQACILVNNFTETEAGQRLLKDCDALCFPDGRIRFLNAKGDPVGAPLQGQMIAYMGANSAKFKKRFNDFGVTFGG